MVELAGVGVTYEGGPVALRDVSLAFHAGEFAVLVGVSGAGKSTLLRCLNGLVKPTTGRVRTNAGDLSTPRVLHQHRRRTAMVFQHHQLIGRLSALRNVMTGRLAYHGSFRSILPLPRADYLTALRCLDRVGLLDRALDRVDTLSGGMQQRVGVARALAQQPDLILADEPVASLDPSTAEQVLTLLYDICKSHGIGAVVSLHQFELARRFADRVIGIGRGCVVYDGPISRLDETAYRRIYDATQNGGAAAAASVAPVDDLTLGRQEAIQA